MKICVDVDIPVACTYMHRVAIDTRQTGQVSSGVSCAVGRHGTSLKSKAKDEKKNTFNIGKA